MRRAYLAILIIFSGCFPSDNPLLTYRNDTNKYRNLDGYYSSLDGDFFSITSAGNKITANGGVAEGDYIVETIPNKFSSQWTYVVAQRPGLTDDFIYALARHNENFKNIEVYNPIMMWLDICNSEFITEGLIGNGIEMLATDDEQLGCKATSKGGLLTAILRLANEIEKGIFADRFQFKYIKVN